MKTLIAAFTSACLIATLAHASPPPVTVAQPVEVKVVNPVTVTGKVDIGNKVEIAGKVETINDALKIPVHIAVGASTDLDNFAGGFYTVPAGMRLTIESVTARMFVTSGQKVLAGLQIGGSDSSSWTEHHLVLQPQGSFAGSDALVASQNLKILLDSTSRYIHYTILRSSNAGTIDFHLTINGYLEEVP